MANEFVSDIQTIRKRARQHMEMVRYIGDADPTTRRMMEEILAAEEEHADDLATLLDTLDPTKKG